MLTKLIIFSLHTILSAYVESIRIKEGWGKRPNVNKVVTNLIWITGAALIAWIGYAGIVNLVFFLFSVTLVRGILYDPFLNHFRQLEIDYQSNTTNSKVDWFEKLIRWDFWKQRRIYLYTLLGTNIIYYALEKLLQNTAFWF